MTHYRMLIDADKCMNCKACVLACQQRNRVASGYSRNWVRQDASGAAKFGWAFQPGGCMQCEHPLCVDACPTRATWKGEDGVVLIDPIRCIGCGACVKACPYDARHRDPVRGVADKCDYCAVTRALGLEPACVSVCSTRARLFGDDTDPASAVSTAMKTSPLAFVTSEATPTGPTLGYIGTPANTAWPREAHVPLPVALMGMVSGGIRWVGGLTLLAIAGVFIKQRISPSVEEHASSPNDGNHGGHTGKGGE